MSQNISIQKASGTNVVTNGNIVVGNGTSVSATGTGTIAATSAPASGITGVLPVANGGTGVTSSTGSGSVVLSTSPVLTTPNLDTPSAVTLTNATGLPLATGVTGTLAINHGGTGVTGTPTNGQLLIGNGSGYTVANITAGSGMSVTNSAGGITLATTGTQTATTVTATITNADSVAITRGQVVYAFGSTGNNMSVKLASNTADATSSKTIGVVSDVSIAPNGQGLITLVGEVSNLNLGSYAAGDTLYLGSTAGSLTNVAPSAPNNVVIVGIVERANNGNGLLYVRIQNGFDLDQIHDVSISSPTTGQTLVYNSGTQLWSNSNAVVVSGGSVNGSPIGASSASTGAFTTLSASGNLTVSGTATIAPSGALSTLTLGDGTAGSYSRVILRGNATQNAWAIYSNNVTSNALEFFPSTAGGGTTFSTAAFTLTSSAATVGGNLTVSGATSIFGGNNAGSQIRLTGDSTATPFGYTWYSGGDYEASMRHIATTGVLTLDIGRSSSWGGKFDIYCDTTRAARFTKTTTTLDGNLTVSGTAAINGGNASITSAAGVSSYLLLNQTSVGAMYLTNVASTGALAVQDGANTLLSVTRTSGNTSVLGTVTTPDVILGTNGPSVKSSLDARAARQGLVFDGTAGGTVTLPAFGTTDFTVALWLRLNAAQLSSIVDANNGLLIDTAADGSWRIFNRSAGSAVYQSAAGALTAGKNYLLVYNRSSVFVNGVSVQSGISDPTSYSASIATVGSNYAGNYAFNGFISLLVYNRALSASEVVSLFEAGVPSGADYASGGAANSVYTTDFSSSTGWTLGPGSTISGGKLNIAPSGYSSAPVATALVKGTQYRFKVTVDSVTSGANVCYYDGVAYQVIATTAGTYTVTFTSPTNYGSLILNSFGGSGAVVDNFTFDRVGLLLAPDAAQAGGGTTWYDTSGNAANITLPASGVSWNVPTSGKLAAKVYLNGQRVDNNNLGLNLTATIPGISFQTDVAGSNRNFAIVNNYSSPALLEFLGSATAQGLPNTSLMALAANGNLLLGTTTDSSNGKLQLATHTTSAGGIGFGADTSWYRTAQGSLALDGGTTSATFRGYNGATQLGYLQFASTYGELNQVSGTLYLKSNNNIALTLDSSQNATFAGQVNILSANSYLKSDASNLVYETYAGKGHQFKTNGTTALTLDSSQNATFAGTVATSGSSNSCYLSVNTNQQYNTAGPVTITVPDNTGGFVTVLSTQSGIGKSSWSIPYVKSGGTIVLGVPIKAIVTADPVVSATASSGNISLALLAANTNCKWGITSTPF